MLLSLAIGDAYGACFEHAPKDFVKKHNTLSGYVKHPKFDNLSGSFGHYTDDTQMSLAIAELMIEKRPWTKEVIAQKFVDVFKRDLHKGDHRTGYSESFYRLLKNVKSGAELRVRLLRNSKKAGAAMRAPPLGLLESEDEILAKAKLQAQITHDTDEGIASAQAAALATHYFAYDLGQAKNIGRYLNKKVRSFRYAWDKPWRGNVGPSGLEAVHAAVYILSREMALSEVLRETVNLTGDVDTVAAIAMAAASTSTKFLPNIPEALVSNLEQTPFGAAYLRKIDRALAEQFPLPQKQPLGSITNAFYNEVVSLRLRIIRNSGNGRMINAECPFCAAEGLKIGLGFYKCFSCGKAGNAITFLVEVMKMTEDEALKFYRKYE